MPGLIPFLLKPTAPAERTRADFQPAHARCLSADTVRTPRPQLASRRLSHQPEPTCPPVLPSTQAEWKRAIAEIKAQHLSRRYRACSARCAEILNNCKDESQVEPAYLIYLHFYAAASMEMCTRPLPLSSPHRTSILHQAQTHYDRASSLIKAAEESVATRTRSSSASSTRSSSLHSPASSISSHTWTADTSIPSPTHSICSFDDLRTKSALSSPKKAGAPKRVKKVSFSLPLCAKEEQEEDTRAATFRFPEPPVRPDSPTLGFDDDYFQAGAALRELPETPPKQRVADLPALVVCLSPSEEEMPLKLEDDKLVLHYDNDYDEDIFLVERSVHRYNETLGHLRAQLASHADNVRTQLALTPVPNSRAVSPVSPRFPVSPTGSRFSANLSSPILPDAKALDKQERIERLRKAGWRRKRFDPQRYEELAKEVLAELQ